MNATTETEHGRSRDPRVVERLLKRELRQDRRSVKLRRLLTRSHVRPVNLHLLTDEEIVLLLSRPTTASRIQLPSDRWWTGDRHGAHAATGATSANKAGANGTGGKAITSTAEPVSERRHRRERPGGDSADRPFPPASQQAADPKNWIEFHLLDDKTDRPISNVPFRLSLPDGSVAEHISDGDGLIRITDLPPGFCDIQAILDQGALEVVRIA